MSACTYMCDINNLFLNVHNMSNAFLFTIAIMIKVLGKYNCSSITDHLFCAIATFFVHTPTFSEFTNMHIHCWNHNTHIHYTCDAHTGFASVHIASTHPHHPDTPYTRYVCQHSPDSLKGCLLFAAQHQHH